MDNSWFLELNGVRCLIDPWLEGQEVDYFSWFNTQWHRTPPLPYDELPEFDAVLITQKYPDHCHEATLQRLRPKVVFAPAYLGSRLTRIVPDAVLHLFDPHEPMHSMDAVRIHHLPTRRKIDPIYDAYFFEADGESLLLANHGFCLDDQHRQQLGHSGHCDVLMSCFNLYSLPLFLGGTVSPGLEGLASLIGQTQPRRVIQTHDELKHARGIVPALARIVPFQPGRVDEHPWLRERYLPIHNYEPVQA